MTAMCFGPPSNANTHSGEHTIAFTVNDREAVSRGLEYFIVPRENKETEMNEICDLPLLLQFCSERKYRASSAKEDLALVM